MTPPQYGITSAPHHLLSLRMHRGHSGRDSLASTGGICSHWAPQSTALAATFCYVIEKDVSRSACIPSISFLSLDPKFPAFKPEIVAKF